MAGVGWVKLASPELGQVGEHVIHREHRAGDRRKLPGQWGASLGLQQAAPSRRLVVSETVDEARGRQFGDAAQRPAWAEKGEWPGVDVDWELGERAGPFVRRVAIGANPQRDRRHHDRARGEVFRTFHVVNLSGEVLDQRRVVEGVDLRRVRITEERSGAGLETDAVDLGEEVAGGGGEQDVGAVALQGRAELLDGLLARRVFRMVEEDPEEDLWLEPIELLAQRP